MCIIMVPALLLGTFSCLSFFDEQFDDSDLFLLPGNIKCRLWFVIKIVVK